MISFKSKDLIIYAQHSGLDLWLLEGHDVVRHVFFNETEKKGASWKTQIDTFLCEIKPRNTRVVLSRAELLQKEIELPSEFETDCLSEFVNKKIAMHYPYAASDMIFDLSFYTLGKRQSALLYAMPGSKLTELITAMSYEVHDITSDDQMLAVYGHMIGERKPVLLLDRSDQRLLCVLLGDQGVVFSRFFSLAETESSLWLDEVSAALTETGFCAQRAVCFGVWTDALYLKVEETLHLEIEHSKPGNRHETPILTAAGAGCKYSSLSLLPPEQKIRKQMAVKKKQLKECLLLLLLVLGCTVLAANSHLLFLQQRVTFLNGRIEGNSKNVKEVKSMAESLGRIDDARKSKLRLLNLLKALATQVPASTRLQELRSDRSEIKFIGEAASHTALTEVVQSVEGVSVFKEVQLEHTRLRKRLNTDYFEFEVNAKWQG